MDDLFLEIERIHDTKKIQTSSNWNIFTTYNHQKSKRKGKKSIWLGVWKHNDPALAFYRNTGFTKHSEHVFYMGDHPHRLSISSKQSF